jgi:uncharacterized repeat protein (TIGR01451 family)
MREPAATLSVFARVANPFSVAEAQMIRILNLLCQAMPLKTRTRAASGLTALILSALMAVTSTGTAQAQGEIMVPFADGFFGDDDGNNTIDASDIQSFSTLGLTASFFSQVSGTGIFEDDSTNTFDPVSCNGGNDIPGRLRIRLGGKLTDIPGCIDGKYKEGGATVAFSFNPQADGALTIHAANPANDIVISPAQTGALNIGIVMNGYTNTSLRPTNSSDANNNNQLDDGEDISGDSSGVLAALNDYLGTAATNAPNGSITTDSVTYITPNAGDIVLTGTFNFGTTAGESLAVIVNDEIYYQGASGNDVVITSGSTWTLTLSQDLPDDTVYNVDAWIINSAQWILQDSTSQELTILGGAPSMTLVKTVQVNAGADGIPQEGETVTYRYVVTNTGAADLENVTITENPGDFSGTGTLPLPALAAVPLTDNGTQNDSFDNGSDASYELLAPGDKAHFTATYILTQNDIDAGTLSNRATANAQINNGASSITDASDDGIGGAGDTGADPTVTTLVAAPALAVTKATTDDDGVIAGATVGQTISWTVTATNTGNTRLSFGGFTDALTADVDETYMGRDTNGDGNIDDATTPAAAQLEPGQSWRWQVNYDLTQANLDAGNVDNIAFVTVTPPGGSATNYYSGADAVAATQTTQPAQGAQVTLPQSALLKVTKTVDDSALQDGVRAGDVLTYTIVVENQGNVTLSGMTLTDTISDANGQVLALTSGPTKTGDTGTATNDAILEPGDTWTYTATYQLTDATIAAGGVENIASGYVDADASGTLDAGEQTVTAESKVSGNTSAQGAGAPTETGFPGELQGTVRHYMNGVAGVDVYLLRETTPGSGVFDYVLDPNTSQRVMTTTDAQGDYSFTNLPEALYGVEFDDPNSTDDPHADSPQYAESGNRITGINIGAGQITIEQDAYFIDPAGVVYDSATFTPIAGAVVTLTHQANIGATPTTVPNSWLNTTLGDANVHTTGADGSYSFLLDPTTAQDGIYALQVVKSGYSYVSTVIPPSASPHDPGLGGGVVNASADATPSAGMDTTYYTSFNMVFDGTAGGSSNGVAQNHLPLDAAGLVPLIEDDLETVLEDDLQATLTQQSRQIAGYAKEALDWLKVQDGCDGALQTVPPVLFDSDSALLRPDQAPVLDELANILAACGTSYEIAGHTDSIGSEAYNQALSQARVDAIRAALVARGVAAERLISTGYGETRPIADNATVEGRAANRRVAFVPQTAAADPGCTDRNSQAQSMTASISNRGVTASGAVNAESYDCATGTRVLMDGAASYLETADGVAQGMATLSLRRERAQGDQSVTGRFVGGYASVNTVSGLASGTINGYGLNGGIYGASRVQPRLFLDYYLAGAVGRHFFDLDFDRAGGAIGATGHYDYGALFAGAAVSGQTTLGGLETAPRAGVDLAWSPGGDAQLTAARGGLTDSSTLRLSPVSGLRAYAELGLTDLTPDSDGTLSLNPFAFCDKPLGGAAVQCGYGGVLSYQMLAPETGLDMSMTLSAERSNAHSYGALSLTYQRPLGRWMAKGGLNLQSEGAVSMAQSFTLTF